MLSQSSVLLFVLASFCDNAALSSALRLEGSPNHAGSYSFSNFQHFAAPHVIIARACKDVRWADDMARARNFSYTVMQAEGVVCKNNIGVGMLSQSVEMRPNKGNEASAYLQYMVTHYETLPEIMVFTHGHNKSRHQDYDMMTQIVERLKLLESMKLDYLTLNNFFGHEGPKLKTNYTVKGVSHLGAPTQGAMGDFFATVIRPYYATENAYQNVVLDNGKCAQFIIKRELIRRIPKHIIEVLMQWLEKGHDNRDRNDEWSNFWTGRLFEFWWPFILNPDNLRANRHRRNGAFSKMGRDTEESEIPHLYDSVYESYLQEFIRSRRLSERKDAEHVKDGRT